jgi:DivIVA domain-containing protein
MERELSAEDVRRLVFGKPPIGKRGYSQDEVDAYLQVIAAALDGRGRLNAKDVHTVAFKKPPVGKRGYDEEQVDAFLDAIEVQLKARESSAGGTSMKSTTAIADAPDMTNDRGADPAAADAEWYEAKFGRPPVANPGGDTPRGLRRFLGSGARGRSSR